MGELRSRLKAWLKISYPGADYPPGSPQGEVEGEDLALPDGDAAAIVSAFVEGAGAAEDADVNRLVLNALERVVPHLTPSGQAYFEPLLAMVRMVEPLWPYPETPTSS